MVSYRLIGTATTNTHGVASTTMTYADGTKIAFQLTKGGVPVANRNVQVIMADGGEPYTKVTGNHGIVYFENGTQCKAGKWKIGAYYYDEDRHKTISSGYKTITINKLKPKITDNFVKDKNGNDTNFIKGSKYVAYLEYDKKPIKNAKLDLYINYATRRNRTKYKHSLYAKRSNPGNY